MVRNGSRKASGPISPDTPLVFCSDPGVPMPRQIGQIFLAGRPVNQADDECPHDRTPLLIGVLDRRFWFQDAFAIPKKLSSARQNGFVSLAGATRRCLSLASRRPGRRDRFKTSRERQPLPGTTRRTLYCDSPKRISLSPCDVARRTELEIVKFE